MSEKKLGEEKRVTDKVIVIIAVVLMTVMVGMTFINAALRYFAGKSIMSFEEYSRFAFVWISYIGSFIAFKKKRHICVTMISDLVKGNAKKAVEFLAEIIILVTCCIIFIAGVYYFNRACTYYTAATNTNFGIIVIGLPLMALAMIWTQIKDMIGRYIKKNGGEQRV